MRHPVIINPVNGLYAQDAQSDVVRPDRVRRRDANFFFHDGYVIVGIHAPEATMYI